MNKQRKELIKLIAVRRRANRFAMDYYFWKDYFSDNNPDPKMSFSSARKVYFSTTRREA